MYDFPLLHMIQSGNKIALLFVAVALTPASDDRSMFFGNRRSPCFSLAIGFTVSSGRCFFVLFALLWAPLISPILVNLE